MCREEKKMRVYIPPNLDDNGGVFGGLVKKQNAIESGIYVGSIFLLVKLLSKYVGVLVAIIVFIVLGIPGAILFLVGIEGQPIGRIIKRRLKYKRNKGIFTLRMPIPKEKK